MKKCPYCAEEIQDEAIVCRYCGRDLAKPTPLPQTIKERSSKKSTGKKITTRLVAFVAACLGCGFLAIAILGLPQKTKTVPTLAATALPDITVESSSTPAPFTGKWHISTSQSEFDNSTTVVLSVPAEDFIQGWLDKTLPTLVLRCKEREIKVYVNVGTQSNVEYGLYDKAAVRVKFDQNKAFEMVTNESTNGEALFFQDPYQMIIFMLNSNEMVFGFTPFNANPAVTTFDLRGLKNVIEPLKKSCSWNGAYPTIPPLPTITPTATPLPSGNSLNLSMGNQQWKIEVEKIIVTKTVTAFGSTEKAAGQFVLLFLRVTNTGNNPNSFSAYGNIQIRNAEGIIYTEDVYGYASSAAADMYGISPYHTKIQPGDVAQQVFAFDLPLDSAFYLLVPGDLVDDNGESLKLEIP